MRCLNSPCTLFVIGHGSTDPEKCSPTSHNFLNPSSANRHMQTLHSKKYGAAHARFTHGGSTIIHASCKENDTIRYLSL